MSKKGGNGVDHSQSQSLCDVDFLPTAQNLCRVIFYSPQLFISLGKSRHDALIATIVTGIVNHCATYVSLWAADHQGRRVEETSCQP